MLAVVPRWCARRESSASSSGPHLAPAGDQVNIRFSCRPWPTSPKNTKDVGQRTTARTTRQSPGRAGYRSVGGTGQGADDGRCATRHDKVAVQWTDTRAVARRRKPQGEGPSTRAEDAKF